MRRSNRLGERDDPKHDRGHEQQVLAVLAIRAHVDIQRVELSAVGVELGSAPEGRNRSYVVHKPDEHCLRSGGFRRGDDLVVLPSPSEEGDHCDAGDEEAACRPRKQLVCPELHRDEFRRLREHLRHLGLSGSEHAAEELAAQRVGRRGQLGRDGKRFVGRRTVDREVVHRKHDPIDERRADGTRPRRGLPVDPLPTRQWHGERRPAPREVDPRLGEGRPGQAGELRSPSLLLGPAQDAIRRHSHADARPERHVPPQRASGRLARADIKAYRVHRRRSVLAAGPGHGASQ